MTAKGLSFKRYKERKQLYFDKGSNKWLKGKEICPIEEFDQNSSDFSSLDGDEPNTCSEMNKCEDSQSDCDGTTDLSGVFPSLQSQLQGK